MFVWRAATLLEEMRALLPDLYEVLVEIAANWGTPRQSRVIEELWPQLSEVTIDHGIMERAARVAVVPVSFGWTDLGDWHSLADVLATSKSDNVALGATHIAEDTSATLVYGRGRTIATLGVDNLVIVDTDDALAALSGDDGSSTLITERNKKALQVLRRELDAGKKRIAIFYGAGHLPDMEARLIRDFRAERQQTEWIVGWDLQADHARTVKPAKERPPSP
jgi:hypothetical protein